MLKSSLASTTGHRSLLLTTQIKKVKSQTSNVKKAKKKKERRKSKKQFFNFLILKIKKKR